jgi:hypothetical protein
VSVDRSIEWDLLQRIDVEGDARRDLERAYFDWLLVSLADAVRQVMLAPASTFTFERRRELVLELLDTIEEEQAALIAISI